MGKSEVNRVVVLNRCFLRGNQASTTSPQFASPLLFTLMLRCAAQLGNKPLSWPVEKQGFQEACDSIRSFLTSFRPAMHSKTALKTELFRKNFFSPFFFFFFFCLSRPDVTEMVDWA